MNGSANRVCGLRLGPSSAWAGCALVFAMGCGSSGAGGDRPGEPSTRDAAGPPSADTGSPGVDGPIDAASPSDAAGLADGGTGIDANLLPDSSGSSGGSRDSGGGRDARAAGDAGDGGAVHAASDGGADPCGPGNPAVVPLPVYGTSAFDVGTFGAMGDGTTDNTMALQSALNTAATAGGGIVSVPAGRFVSGPIVVGSGTRLDLAAGAVLEMLPMSRWPAATTFITANRAHDIGITGSGTIEGHGQDWWNALTANPTLARGQEVAFTNSTRVQISGIRLQNPPAEHIWVKGDTDVTITGITIETLAVAGQHGPSNTDGVDIGANGVFFCGNSISCGDDNVVMSGSSVYVAYSTFGVGHGCSIGSITQNGVSGVTVDHITFSGTTTGIRMKSARGRGGLVQNLSYSNLTMTNVGNPVFIGSYYPTLPADPRTDPAQPLTATTPMWQNITIKNLTAVGSTMAGILWGLPEAQISQVVFDNVSIRATQAMEIFHATGISFINGSTVTVTPASAVVTSDATVTGIATRAF
jgi:polygalacturonase